ncbi:hypothetical protein QTP86_004035 [Hemibagrus guttatus]|nr:hypothetical protein QTP86_004035 [Hemibagrus guttatus]
MVRSKELSEVFRKKIIDAYESDHEEGIGGSVVDFSPTIRKARVRFPANAQTPATGCSIPTTLTFFQAWDWHRKGIRRKTCAKLCGPVGPLWRPQIGSKPKALFV